MHSLITGGAGFIGSHLADALLLRGDRVTVLDNLSTGRLENIASQKDNPDFRFVNGSILDGSVVDELVSGADVVYHLAAAVGVQLILDRPLEALTTNIHGTEVVLDAVHRHHKKMLFTSTSEVYGKNTSDALEEDDDRILGSPLKTRWGYSMAKALDELVAHLFWKEKGVSIVIVRLFNTVGPRQSGAYGMVIPRFVGQALRGEDVTIFGTGRQRRCFLHVADAIRAFLLLIQNEQAFGSVLNVGSSSEISIEDLAKKIIAMTGSRSRLVYIPYEKAYGEDFEDMERRVPSTERLGRLIGWTPTVDLDTILQSVVAAFSV